MASLRTPLGRVRGRGSAKHGVGAYIAQRVSAVALVLLVLWAINAALSLARMNYASTVGWLHSPWHATPVILLIAIAFFHMHIGMREIVVDYIAKPGTRNALLLLNVFVCVAGAVLGLFGVLSVAFSSGAL